MINSKPDQLDRAASLLEIPEESLLRILEFNYEQTKLPDAIWTTDLNIEEYMKKSISDIESDIRSIWFAAAGIGRLTFQLFKNKEIALSILGDKGFESIENKIQKEIENVINDALKNHKNLLHLSGLHLDKIPEKINNLRQLEDLVLWGNNIKDLAPLGNFQKLKTLSLESNKISDIRIIGTLKNLELLGLSNNKIKNIEPLRVLDKIKNLHLANNYIKNIEPLSSIKSLQFLDLNNNVIDESGLKEVLKIENLQNIYLLGSGISADKEIVESGMADRLRKYYNIDVFPNKPQLESNRNADIIKPEDNKIKSPSEVTDKTGGQETKTPTEAQKNNDETQENKAGVNGTITIVEPIEASVEEQTNAQESSDGTIEKPESGESKKEPDNEYRSYATGKISILGTPENQNLLDVEKLSKIFYDFIAECQDNSEQFFGLFGRWGRGKTHLWRYLRDHNIDKSRFIPVEFHAWKYQDTPGLWAYLYGELNKKYFEDAGDKKNAVANYFSKARKLIKLNYVRGKILRPALLFLSGILLSTVLFIILATYTDWLKNTYIFIPSLIGLVGINLAALINQIEKYKEGAKQIITQITSNVSFRNQLGLQHEIQEELKYLLETWIPNKEKNKKRILLFIDDIDRCSEDKIIQIVDYIRVLLDETEIQSRITIMAAIDERILIHAIQNKYRKFVENKDNDATFKELCREYMDKLFLAGLKLGPLTGFEKDEMVDGFTKGYLKKEKEVLTVLDNRTPASAETKITFAGKSPIAFGDKIPPPETIADGLNISDSTVRHSANKRDVTSSLVIESEKEEEQSKDPEYSLEKWEQDFLKEIMEKNTEATPRSIRVYTFRYLLGKKLIEKPLRNEEEPSWKQWYNGQDAKRCFALKLFHYTYKSDVEELYSKYSDFMSDYKDENEIDEKIYNFSLTINQKLGSIMYQTLTMIVAY